MISPHPDIFVSPLRVVMSSLFPSESIICDGASDFQSYICVKKLIFKILYHGDSPHSAISKTIYEIKICVV